MPRWVEVPGAAGLAEGTLHPAVVDGAGLVLARCGGRWFAVEDRCSHDDGPLGEGRFVEGCQVECPRHGARFSLEDGRATRMPAATPIRSVPVRVSEGRVFVDAEAL